jgi:dimethylsulfone monooxygenase
VRKGFAMPKPIQRPFPPLMNAGSSGKGQHFAAKYADMAFVTMDASDLDKSQAHIAAYRRLAREEYGRDIQIWCNATVVQRETQKEAEEYLHHYVVEKGDDEAIETLVRVQGEQMQRLLPQKLEQIKFSIKAGWGGYPLIGTADRIVERVLKLSEIGISGLLLNWVEYVDGMRRWRRDVMPRLEQAGLRRPMR